MGMSATDSLGKQWGNPGLVDAGPAPSDGRSQEYRDWHAKTFSNVAAQQREYPIAVVKGHLADAREARQRGDAPAARKALARAGTERRIAARLRST